MNFPPKVLRNFVLSLLLVLATLIGVISCSEKNETLKPRKVETPKVPETAPAKAAAEEVHEAPKKQDTAPIAINENWLARLNEFSHKVDFRLSKESVWQNAAIGNTFDRFDALQTHDSAKARVNYKSGSRLDLEENTLVVFDKDPGDNKRKSPDKVVVKSGGLTGATVTELWVFTNAGLVQVKPTKSQKNAKVKLSLQKNNELSVKVDSGTADLVYRTPEKEFKRINISANNEISYKAPVLIAAAESTKQESSENATEFVKELNTAAVQVTQFTKTELSVEAPADNLNVGSPEIEVKGKLSGIGAKLLINGQIADVDSSFNFKKNVQLTEGVNLIVFQLVRSDSSVQFVRRTIRYKKE
ncbi:MAG: hypothetical protein ACXWQQ_08285 [Pseudobdellovibrio sp.]